MAEEQQATAGMRVISPADWGVDQGLLGGGTWREIVGPGIGSECRGLYDLQFAQEGRSVILTHDSEAAYYVVAGTGTVEHADGEQSHELTDGSMVHVRPGTPYRLTGAAGTRLVGGPCPATSSITGAPVHPAAATDLWPAVSLS
ncbi:MAG: cupin domain-containing protein [Mycobacterium sp.]|nr:cupin domain-containing protein [Mycobacterium sp.]